MSRLGRRPRSTHAEIVEQAKATPGEWVRVGAYRSNATAKGIARGIRVGRRELAPYGPAGSFDTRVTDREFDTEVHARFTGGAA